MQRNVLFIALDTTGAEHLSCYWYPEEGAWCEP